MLRDHRNHVCWGIGNELGDFCEFTDQDGGFAEGCCAFGTGDGENEDGGTYCTRETMNQIQVRKKELIQCEFQQNVSPFLFSFLLVINSIRVSFRDVRSCARHDNFIDFYKD